MARLVVSQCSLHLNRFFETTVFEIGKTENVYVDSYCLIVHVPLRYPILKDRARDKYGGVGVLGMISACSMFNLVSPLLAVNTIGGGATQSPYCLILRSAVRVNS